MRTHRVWPRALLIAAAILFARVAGAHVIVDVGVSLRAPAFAPQSSVITYKIDVSDFAYDSAYGIVVSDQLGAGLRFTSASGGGWNCSASGRTVTCSAEIIGPGVSTITVVASAPSSGTAENTASVTSLGSIDPDASNDTSTAKTVLYDPAACGTTVPNLLTPPEQATVADGIATLSWSVVPGALLYRVWVGVEGALPAIAGETSGSSLSISAEPGTNEWWVEAIHDQCPSSSTAHQHFYSMGPVLPVYVSDYAGQAGVRGFADGALNDATFDSPAALGIDMKGTIWVADSGMSTLRRISKGVVTTIAGQPGVPGTDDGPATFAGLNHPGALAVSASGDVVYIADTGNHVIRVLYTTGNGIFFGPLMATLAGSAGQQGTTDASADNARFTAPDGIALTSNYTIYVGDTGTDRIRRLNPGFPVMVNSVAGTVSAAGATDGPASTARFNGPTGVAVDAAGNVFVADTENNLIRRLGVDGLVTTVAGAPGAAGFVDGIGSVARFDHPRALAFDSLGNLYVADTGNHAIRRIAPSHLVSTIIGTGAAGHRNGVGLVAMLSSPSGVAFDPSGRLYIADTGNSVIRVATTAAPEPSVAPPRRRAVSH